MTTADMKYFGETEVTIRNLQEVISKNIAKGIWKDEAFARRFATMPSGLLSNLRIEDYKKARVEVGNPVVNSNR